MLIVVHLHSSKAHGGNVMQPSDARGQAANPPCPGGREGEAQASFQSPRQRTATSTYCGTSSWSHASWYAIITWNASWVAASKQHAPPAVHAAARMAWFVSAAVVFEQSMTGHADSAGSYWRVMAHPKQ